MSKFLKRLSAPVALSVALILCACASAFAAAPGTVEIQPCSTDEPSSLWKLQQATGWAVIHECPHRIGLSTVSGVTYNSQTPYLNYPDPFSFWRSLQLIEATAYLTGDDGSSRGMQIGLRACPASGPCGDLVTVSGGASETPVKVTMSAAAGGMPLDARYIRLEGVCVRISGCDAGSRLEASGIVLTFADVVAPAVRIESTGIGQTVAGQWNSIGAEISYYANDGDGSGVLYATPHRTNYPGDRQHTSCGAGVAVLWKFCGRTYQNRMVVDDRYLGYWDQGLNTVEIDAFDMAYNKGTASISFKYDSIAPDPPLDLRAVNAAEDGWIGEADADLVWSLDGELEETATESGVTTARVDVNPLESGMPDPAPVEQPIDPSHPVASVTLPADGRWKLRVSLRDRAGNWGSPAGISVGRDTSIPGEPRPVPSGWLGLKDLAAPTALNWEPPVTGNQDLSGICGYALLVDDDPNSVIAPVISVDGNVTGARLPAGVGDGSHWAHLRAVSCAGVGGTAANFQIKTDFTPPKAMLKRPAGDWIAANDPLLVEGEDALSMVAAVHHSVDAGLMFSRDGESVQVAIPEGVHAVTFSAEDHAGNRSAEQTETVRVDASAPTGHIHATDPGDPRTVRASVMDPGSGVSMAWLEFRRAGDVTDSPWRPLGRPLRPPTDADHDVTLAAEFPDGEVESGVYQLRVVAYDRVGHAFAGSVRVNGDSAIVHSPLRDQPGVTALLSSRAKPCKVKRGKRCPRVSQPASSITVDYGAGAILNGRLVSATGDPLAGLRLEILERPEGGVRALVGEVTSDADGEYALNIPFGVARQIIVRFSGDRGLTPAEGSARLLARGSATLKAPRSVRGGAIWSLTGTVPHAGATIPRVGKRVELEIRLGSRWETYGKPVATDSAGRFVVRRVAPRARRPLRLPLRVRVPGETGWPFVVGYSREFKVLVRR